MGKAVVFLAEGFEEVEALTVVDLLRRADVTVEMVSIMESANVTGTHGIKVVADEMFETFDRNNVDLIVLPGGMPGTINLRNNVKLAELLIKENGKGTYISAICAGPTVLGAAGLLKGKRAVCYPASDLVLEGAIKEDTPVCTDGNIVTATGVGTAIPFALELIKLLKDEKTSISIGKEILYLQ